MGDERELIGQSQSQQIVTYLGLELIKQELLSFERKFLCKTASIVLNFLLFLKIGTMDLVSSARESAVLAVLKNSVNAVEEVA